MKVNITAAQRQYVYNVVTVAAPLLVVYGVLDTSVVGLWLAVADAVLGLSGTGLAAVTLKGQRADGTVE